MSSRDTSRSSSRHSDDSRASTPIRTTADDAPTRVAALPDAPDDASQLLLLVLNGRAPAVSDFCGQVGPARCVELCGIEHDHDGKRGNVFLFAARKNDRGVIRALCTGCCPSTAAAPASFPPSAASTLGPLLTPAIRGMIEEDKFSVVVFLLSLCPSVGLGVVHLERGDTVLHALCRRPAVPAWCIQDVLALFVALLPPRGGVTIVGRSTTPSSPTNMTNDSITSPSRQHAASRLGGRSSTMSAKSTTATRKLPYINTLNAKGLTALHLAATHIRGLAGGDIAKMLLRHGADEKITTPAGQSVLHICLNGHIRAQLGIIQSRSRGVEAPLDDEVKQKIDECPNSDTFPVLPDIVEEPAVSPSRQHKSGDGTASAGGAAVAAAGGDDDDDGGRKKGDPLSAEDEEALLQRLYDQSIRQKSSWYDEKYRELEEVDQKRYHARQLAADEVEGSVARLYQESVDKQAETVAELNEKYLKERPPGPAIEPEDLEAACQRLCQGSLDKKAAIRKELQDKFYPPKEKKKLSKSTMADSALRLCTASQEKTSQEHQKLFEQYACAPKGRFSGGNGPLSKDQVKALGDRLSKKA